MNRVNDENEMYERVKKENEMQTSREMILWQAGMWENEMYE